MKKVEESLVESSNKVQLALCWKDPDIFLSLILHLFYYYSVILVPHTNLLGLLAKLWLYMLCGCEIYSFTFRFGFG